MNKWMHFLFLESYVSHFPFELHFWIFKLFKLTYSVYKWSMIWSSWSIILLFLITAYSHDWLVHYVLWHLLVALSLVGLYLWGSHSAWVEGMALQKGFHLFLLGICMVLKARDHFYMFIFKPQHAHNLGGDLKTALSQQ
jgi:hypothetical protein